MIIGINGAIESGKSTVAKYLCEDHGYTLLSVGDNIRQQIVSAPFEDFDTAPEPVRRVAERLKQIGTLPAIEVVFAKPTPPDVRAALQWYGQLKRKQYPEHWVDSIKCDIASACLHKKSVDFALGDMRSASEFKFCWSYGQTWKVINYRDQQISLYAPEIRHHAIETELDYHPFTQYLSNNGTLKDLRRLVGVLVKGYDIGHSEI